jgi:hypothetical protein
MQKQILPFIVIASALSDILIPMTDYYAGNERNDDC